MTTSTHGTVLENTVSILKSLLGANAHGVTADNIDAIIKNVGSALLTVKHDDEGNVPAPARIPLAAPAVSKSEAPAPTEIAVSSAAPAAMATTTVAAQDVAKPRRGRPPKNAVASAPQVPVAQVQVIESPTANVAASDEQQAPRKRGRPKGSGKKQLEAIALKSVQETLGEDGQVITFDNPDPLSPNYKFKHLRDRYGVLPNGQAKRFNDLKVTDKVNETVDGDMIICLFDGEKRKMLKRYLSVAFG